MSNDISDLRPTIVPKSDQLNAEQLLGGPMTITLTDVRMGSSEEQPISLHYANDQGRPYKPCKTMRKLLIFCWGQDGRAWVGKSMTLYNDPAVAFGGMKVGGIRISHLSDSEKAVQVSLTATKGKKTLHTVGMLEVMTLAKVLEAIRNANNRAGMDLAKGMAAQLTNEADVQQARAAYADKVKALQAAKTLDEAQAVIAQAEHLPEDQQDELRALAASLAF